MLTDLLLGICLCMTLSLAPAHPWHPCRHEVRKRIWTKKVSPRAFPVSSLVILESLTLGFRIRVHVWEGHTTTTTWRFRRNTGNLAQQSGVPVFSPYPRRRVRERAPRREWRMRVHVHHPRPRQPFYPAQLGLGGFMIFDLY